MQKTQEVVSNNVHNVIDSIVNCAPDSNTRVIEKMEIGQAIRQGDVYIHRVNDTHPRGELIGTRQVAIGDHVGARHRAEGPLEVRKGEEFPEWVNEPEWVEEGCLLGPVVVATEPWTLTHPEHSHAVLPTGVYQVTYQADGLTHRRVQD